MRSMMMAVTLLGLSGVSPAASPAPIDGLVEFANAFDRAQLAKDGPALEKMVDDGLVFITGDGRRLGKKEFIAGWTDPADRYDPIRLSDRTITLLGPEAAMVGAETTLSGTSGGKPFASRFRFTDTFRKVGAEWRAVHIQVTLMK